MSKKPLNKERIEMFEMHAIQDWVDRLDLSKPRVISLLHRLAHYGTKGARLLRVSSGIHALEEAFELEDDHSLDEHPCPPVSKTQALSMICMVMNRFVENRDQVSKKNQQPLLWATYCLRTGCNPEFMIPEDDPFIEEPMDEHASPDEKVRYHLIHAITMGAKEEVRESLNIIEAFVPESVRKLKEKIEKFKDKGAIRIGEIACRCVVIALEHHDHDCVVSEFHLRLSSLFADLAIAMEDEEIQTVKDLREKVNKEFIDSLMLDTSLKGMFHTDDIVRPKNFSVN